MTTGREDQLKRWSEWSQERLVRWWRAVCRKRVTAKKKKEREGRRGRKVGSTPRQPSIWDAWGRGRNMGARGYSEKEMGDGEDDPG